MIASRPSRSERARASGMPRTPRSNTLGSTRKAPAVPPSKPQKHLDVFANPNPDRDYVIQFVIPEFTCNCPLTGQPDFAHFTIDMVADRLCIELKSLKLYFWSYRDVGAFHEQVTNTIVDDIVAATKPRFVRIVARWNVRGGIYTNVVAEHRKKGWAPAPAVVLAHESDPGARHRSGQ
jgi:7-cyano-7-deazaguanine reductase